MINTKLIYQHQKNPFYDEHRKHNGGGYDQRYSIYEVEGGFRLEISDDNIGDFGDDYTVTLWQGETLLAMFSLNDRQGDCDRGMQSTFTTKDQLQREIMEFCEKIQFPITPIEWEHWDYVDDRAYYSYY
jgi:hypothetical protein